MLFSGKIGETINSISVTALNAASDIPTNEENTTENITTADSEITTAETTMTTATDTATNISNILKGITQGKSSYIEPAFIQEWTDQNPNKEKFAEIRKYLHFFTIKITSSFINTI